MPMKQGLLPKWSTVIRDLKRGAPKIVVKDNGTEMTRYVTLANSMIPDKHMAETNPNNPTKPDDIKAWDTERLQWATFKISELEEYNTAPGYGWEQGEESGKEISTGETSRSSKKGSGNRSTEGNQASEETQTDDRGTETESTGESSKG